MCVFLEDTPVHVTQYVPLLKTRRACDTMCVFLEDKSGGGACAFIKHTFRDRACAFIEHNNNNNSIFKAQNLVPRDYSKRAGAHTHTHTHTLTHIHTHTHTHTHTYAAHKL